MKRKERCQKRIESSLIRISKLGLLILSMLISLHFTIQSALGQSGEGISEKIKIFILRAEDERIWNDDLKSLLSDKNIALRKRAALACGRIGDERAVEPLINLLKQDSDASVRAMAAFALGEIESVVSANALIEKLRSEDDNEIRARSIEALGKIGAALPQSEKEKAQEIGKAILNALESELGNKSFDDKIVLKGLTAALRVRPANAGGIIAKFLNSENDSVRENATNALARLRAKEGNERVRLLLANDKDPIVRANAARVLGATEDRESINALLERATKDVDQRVRVSSIRALGVLKDERVAKDLISRALRLAENVWGNNAIFHRPRLSRNWNQQSEWLEIFTTLGNIYANEGGDNKRRPIDYTYPIQLSARTLALMATEKLWLDINPEVHIAAAKINPDDYLYRETINPFQYPNKKIGLEFFKDWHYAASVAQGLSVIASLSAEKYGTNIPNLQSKASKVLGELITDLRLSERSVPDILRAYAAFKPNGLREVLIKHLKAKDVIIRATAAELLGELPPNEENTKALVEALPITFKDELNDAALAILDALGKQKNEKAIEAIKTALKSNDYIVRSRAAQILKKIGVGDFSSLIGTVQTKNTEADYKRALVRKNGSVKAIVETEKGSFTINLLPEDAPLTVDNFINLARKGYFKNIIFHRVVPNFVIQGGDPRSDGNGGPGYQIRCEINEVEYTRGAVGMALSGKDTGGSQWFVTHSPQPHLDGGYTVFGVIEEKYMKVVDSIVRGNRILNIRLIETKTRARK